MKRTRLFEFEDLPWLPAALRRGIQDFLVTSHRVFGFYKAWAPILADVLRHTGSRRIIDLCSGAGGPAPLIARELRTVHGLDVTVTMTDLYPNPDAAARIRALDEPGLEYLEEPVDATDIPAHLAGTRTIFAGFHHMPPALAQRILADACHKRQPICIFEYTHRSWRGLLTSLSYPLIVWALTPFVRPLRLSRLALTYPLPILPALIWWDGLVSNLRTYTEAEMRTLTEGLSRGDYAFITTTLHQRGYPIPLTVTTGIPSEGP